MVLIPSVFKNVLTWLKQLRIWFFKQVIVKRRPLPISISRVFISCLTTLATGPRPRRSILLCKEIGFSIDVLSEPFNSEYLEVEKVYSLSHLKRKGLFRRSLNRLLFEAWKRRRIFPIVIRAWLSLWRIGLDRLRPLLEDNQYQLIICEDLYLVPFFLKFQSEKTKIVLDAREYYPKEFESDPLFNLYEKPEREYVCRKYLPLCDHVFTVSEGLAREYNREFGVKPTVFRSVPAYHDIPVRLTSSPLRFVHMGNANPDRKIENMISIFREASTEGTLDFYLVGNQDYIQRLIDLAEGDPRISFREAVPFNSIIQTLSNYDIGFYFLEPTGFNTTFNLPNKLFEFIQARLAVLIGPSPCMAEVVRQYQCGFVCDDFSNKSMIELIQSLTLEKVNLAKQNSDLAARELCIEKEKNVFMDVVKKLVPHI